MPDIIAAISPSTHAEFHGSSSQSASYVSNLSLFGLQGLQKELPFQIMYFDHILQVNHDFVQSFN
jgi:hypothetical protein